MARHYPQFSLRTGPGGTWWEGWLVPFGSRLFLRYKLVLVYTFGREPIAWIVDPEISKRTWPKHRHLFGFGNLCPQDPTAPNWKYGRDDLTYYLDLVVLWIGCHVHLEEYGRWPGPESADSHRHGPPSFQSTDGIAERLIQAFVARYGIRRLREKLPNAGVPLWLVERWDLAAIGDQPVVATPGG